MNRFSFELQVPASAIDVMNHVNNVVYLDWVQMAASKHWNHCTQDYFNASATDEQRLGISEMAWVVMDHHITYKAPAFEGETLQITTSVKKMTAATSERHTEILRPSDGQLIVTAVTHWCLLKMPDAKPMRIPREIKQLFMSDASSADAS